MAVPADIVHRAKLVTDQLDSEEALCDHVLWPKEPASPLQFEKGAVQKWVELCKHEYHETVLFRIYDTDTMCAVLKVADFLRDEAGVKICLDDLINHLSLSGNVDTICASLSEDHIARMFYSEGLVRLDELACLPMDIGKCSRILDMCLAKACAPTHSHAHTAPCFACKPVREARGVHLKQQLGARGALWRIQSIKC